MKNEEFKRFVRTKPELIKYVQSGEMTWQKFYELYDMYGEDNEIWNDYQNNTKKSSTTLNDVITLAKNIDVDKLQTGVESLSKAVGLFSDLFANKSTPKADTYKPRAIYKRFED